MFPEHNETFVVRHWVPGRLRLSVPSIQSSWRQCQALRDRLQQLEGVKKAEARMKTGSVIVTYHFRALPRETLLRFLEKTIIDIFTDPGQEEERCGVLSSTTSRKPYQSRSLLYPLINVSAIGLFLLYALIKKYILKSPLKQAPLSPVGVVAIVGALPLLQRSLRDLREGNAGLFPFLMAACSLAISTGQALTALEIIWVLGLGMLAEQFVSEKARKGVREILQVAPEKTFLLQNGAEVEMSVSEIKAGDIVVVRTGDKIPVDGSVGRGEGLIDEAHITGRAQPELRARGDHVYAGTRVRQGSLQVRAEMVGEDTYLCRISHLVEEALSKRADAEKRADVLAIRLTRLGLAATFATYLVTRSLERSFSVLLMMACPCATVLAASTAVAAGIANAARNRILVKGGLYLEQIDGADCFCFDKTGTITTDDPQVVEIFAHTSRQDPSDIVALAAGVETASDHPLAKAIIREAERRGRTVRTDAKAEVFVGRGVKAKMGEDVITVGNQSFLESEGVTLPPLAQRVQELRDTGHTLLFVARNHRVEGNIAVANKLRPGVKKVMDGLHDEGCKHLYVISGDTEASVRTIADDMDFDGYKADLLPEEKARFVERLQQNGKRVVMLGDGVNDALALSKAAVGVAMGTGGSEVAIEAADIALVRDDLSGLLVLRRLSRKTLATIEQNFWIATGTNMIGIVLGSTGLLSPLMAGLFHLSHTFGILFNSGRLVRWNPYNNEEIVRAKSWGRDAASFNAHRLSV